MQTRKEAQLSQRNRAAGWVSFWWVRGDGVGQTILCTKRCRWQKKLKSIDLVHNKSTFIRKTVTLRFEPPSGGGGEPRGNVGPYAVHLRLIGKPVVDLLLVIIELFFTRCFCFVTNSCVWRTDRQMDRRTALRSPIPCLHRMQRGKRWNQHCTTTWSRLFCQSFPSFIVSLSVHQSTKFQHGSYS